MTYRCWDGWGTFDKQSKPESACQTHDVVGVDLGFDCLQPWQIVPIDVDERRFGVHIVPVQCQRVVGQYSLCLGNSREAVRRFFRSCNELVVVERVIPTEVDGKRIGSIAWLASGWGWKG